MLYREIIAVCSEIHTKHINTVCGQNVEFLNIEPGGTPSYPWNILHVWYILLTPQNHRNQSNKKTNLFYLQVSVYIQFVINQTIPNKFIWKYYRKIGY